MGMQNIASFNVSIADRGEIVATQKGQFCDKEEMTRKCYSWEVESKPSSRARAMACVRLLTLNLP